MVFDWQQLKGVLNYGLNLTGFSVFNYFARNADNLLIGRFLGATELGYYDMAYRLMMYPLQTLWSVLGRVLFPIYAQMQSDHARFGAAFLKVSASIALIAFPAMIGLMLVAKPFVITLFGVKWEPMIPVLVILAGVGAVQSVGTTVGYIYQTKGRTDWLLRWGIFAGTVTVVAFVIGVQWGIIGVATAYAVAALLLTYPSFAIPFRLIDMRVSQLLVALWRPCIATMIMAGVVLAAKLLIGARLGPASSLSILVVAGAASYMVATWWIDRSHLRELAGAFGVRVRG
jgi:PST family polysaccharide transporter